MSDLDFPNSIRQAGDNIVIIRSQLAESRYLCFREVDVNPSPPSLVENESIRDVERIIGARINVNALENIQITERIPNHQVLSILGKRDLQRTNFFTAEWESRPVAQVVEQRRADGCQQFCNHLFHSSSEVAPQTVEM